LVGCKGSGSTLKRGNPKRNGGGETSKGVWLSGGRRRQSHRTVQEGGRFKGRKKFRPEWVSGSGQDDPGSSGSRIEKKSKGGDKYEENQKKGICWFASERRLNFAVEKGVYKGT